MAKRTDAAQSLLRRKEPAVCYPCEHDHSATAVANRPHKFGKLNEPLSEKVTGAVLSQEVKALWDDIRRLLEHDGSGASSRELAVIASRYRILTKALLERKHADTADDTYGATEPRSGMSAETAHDFVGHVFVRIADVVADAEKFLRVNPASDEEIAEGRSALEQVMGTVGRSHVLVDNDGALRHVPGVMSFEDAQQLAGMLSDKTRGAVQMFVLPAKPDRPPGPQIKLA